MRPPENRDHTFYVTGGTLPYDAPCYIRRRADEELVEALRQGHFCYVLTSRQMGKSSLMNRAAARMREEGWAVAQLDLTGIGHNLTVEQWYDGLVYELGRELGLKAPLQACWNAHAALGPLHRFLAVLQEGVLAHIDRPVVLFVDEIEVVRSLPFSTDEFFAAIRECFNRRAQEPALGRLTFCLLGMATPSDLIRDTRITPFNIGRRIELTDFTEEEAIPLARGLPGDIRMRVALLKRVLYWTGGHPYLTQRLCYAVVKLEEGARPREVDRLCEEMFLSRQAREVDANLVPVREFLLKSRANPTDLLGLYRQVRAGGRVREDETSLLVTLLRLSGIVRVERGFLRVRNRIYARVFDRAWIQAHLPDAELRRQIAVYRRELVRTAAFSGLALSIMGALTAAAFQQKRAADHNAAAYRQEVRQTRRLLTVANLNLAQRAYQESNITRALALLSACPEADASARRFEWRYLWGLCHQDLRTDAGFGGGALAVAFGPDGNRMVAVSGDGDLQIRDTATGEVSQSFRIAPTVYAAAISPEGEMAAMGVGKGGILIRSLKEDAPTRQLIADRQAVSALAFSPDHKTLATGSYNGQVKVWDLHTGEAIQTRLRQTDGVCALLFTQDGRRLLVAGKGGAIREWDTATGSVVRVLRGHTDTVFRLALSPDGERLASGGRDAAVRLWDMATGRLVRTLTGHQRAVRALAFSPEGRLLATGSDDQTVRVWNAQTGRLQGVLRGHQARILSLTFSPDSRLLLSGSEDGTAKLWGWPPPTQQVTLQGRKSPNLEIAFSGDLSRVAIGSETGSVTCWDVPTGKRIWTIQAADAPLLHVAFSPDGRMLATRSLWGPLRVWDTLTGRALGEIGRGGRSVLHSAFALDGRSLVIAWSDSTVSLWDALTGSERRILDRGGGQVRRLALSSDGRWLATTDQAGAIRLWNMRTGQLARTIPQTDGIGPPLFSPDSRTLAVRIREGQSLLLVDTTSGQTRPLEGSSAGMILSAAFSPDSRTLATGGTDKRIILWDVETGMETCRLEGHTEYIDALAFSRDGSLLVSLDSKQQVRFWPAVRDMQNVERTDRVPSNRSFGAETNGAPVRSHSAMQEMHQRGQHDG